MIRNIYRRLYENAKDKAIKYMLFILLIFLVSKINCQIEVWDNWSEKLKVEFLALKNQNIDTFLVYFEKNSPWTTLTDSCKSVPYAIILYVDRGNYLARELFCGSSPKDTTLNISSVPIDYYIAHMDDYNSRNHYLLENNEFALPPTDDFREYLIFMTLKENIVTSISNYQGTNDNWTHFKEIFEATKIIDLIKSEIE